MKNEQQEEAKNLYFQTNMSKTEIAKATGVNRRTILLWAKQGNWDQLRQSSRHMPSLVAEKCYYLIDNFASRLLQDPSLSLVSRSDAQTIYLLATSIKKLKNRSTINESMEMFSFFFAGLRKRNPRLAEEILPEIEEYISIRRDHEVSDFLLEGFDKNGRMEYPDKEQAEQYADNEDLQALDKEIELTGNYDHAVQTWQNSVSQNQPSK